jgi:hypothetical protein
MPCTLLYSDARQYFSYRTLLTQSYAQFCLQAMGGGGGLSLSVCMSLVELRELSSVSKLMQNQFQSEERRAEQNEEKISSERRKEKWILFHP